MSKAELERVRADLATMQEAAGVGLPFGRSDAWIGVVIAACGGLMAAWAAWVPWEHRWGVVAPVLFFTAAYAALGRHVGRRKGREPVRWREFRLTLVAMAVIGPLAVGYMFWEDHLGVPRGIAGAAAVFFVSLGGLMIGIADPSRRHYIGSALPGMALGVAFPLLSARGATVAAGLCLAATGLLTSAVQAWLLRNSEGSRAAD